MKLYQIQRAISKIVYMHIIEAILLVVKREKIKQIQTLFCETFWHILHTLEGHLLTFKSTFLANFHVDISGDDKSIGILDFRFNS